MTAHVVLLTGGAIVKKEGRSCLRPAEICRMQIRIQAKRQLRFVMHRLFEPGGEGKLARRDRPLGCRFVREHFAGPGGRRWAFAAAGALLPAPALPALPGLRDRPSRFSPGTWVSGGCSFCWRP